MNNLDFIARLAKDGFYNPNCELFGGDNLIVTDNGPHTNDFGDTIVVHTEADILNYLVYCHKSH
jgi:hypothetical protein